MPFLGNTPAEQYKTIAKQTITGTGATVYTLDYKVTTASELEVFVNNVRQEPEIAYTVSGNQITFTTAVESSDSCYIIFQSRAATSNLIESQNIADGAITAAKLASGAGLPDAIDVNASAPADSLNIDASGKVGIGTSSPDNVLHIKADAPIIKLEDNQAGGGYHQLGNSNSDGTLVIYADADGTNSSTANMRFSVGGTERMRIDNAGNVGIGTSSPISGNALTAKGSTTDNIALQYSGTAGNHVSAINFYDFRGQHNASIGNNLHDDGVGTQKARLVFKTAYNGTPSERMRIDASGNINVNMENFGTYSSNTNYGISFQQNGANPYINHYTNGSGFSTMYAFGNDNGIVGTINTNGSGTSYNTSSDYRLKENVVDMTDAIDRVKALQPKRFNFIADADTTVDGFLAHEVSDVIPEAISGEKDATKEEEYEVTPAVLDDDGNVVTEAVMGTRTVPDYQGIDQSKLVPLLTGALQEAIAKIEALETRIETLENA